ncbi:DUF2913 family protein [Photobacterium phosphoreum]|uniref:DUF2913 family protein n=1 Tax=Photobacterium phosphoreum TaxID=659 RepID=UPI0024B846A6|nr:DUF2913 family protein [Photobacterium phosphoreum]
MSLQRESRDALGQDIPLPKQHYHQQLSTLIDNALLHLYSQVAISRRFVPTAKRNTLLCQYLKPKIGSVSDRIHCVTVANLRSSLG